MCKTTKTQRARRGKEELAANVADPDGNTEKFDNWQSSQHPVNSPPSFVPFVPSWLNTQRCGNDRPVL